MASIGKPAIFVAPLKDRLAIAAMIKRDNRSPEVIAANAQRGVDAVKALDDARKQAEQAAAPFWNMPCGPI